jgi:hypothetical protein
MKYKVRSTELKVGDEVFVEANRKGTVTSMTGVPSNRAHVKSPDGNVDRDVAVNTDGYWNDNNGGYLLKENAVPPKFIVVYDQPSRRDPTELFATLPEVKERVEELIKKNLAIPDSIRVYTIAKIESVGYKITFKEE